MIISKKLHVSGPLTVKKERAIIFRIKTSLKVLLKLNYNTTESE
jgi:hypothetical protein